MQPQSASTRILDRLDALSPSVFTGVLYAVRWLVVLPWIIISWLSGSGGEAESPALRFNLVIGVVLDPLLETLIECAIPYWLMRKVFPNSLNQRPWKFVALSAIVMTVMHIGAWPAAIFPAFITGSFLAYTYGHFALNRQSTALLHTWAFHSGINIVGWLLMVV